jgi:hypothetical protein
MLILEDNARRLLEQARYSSLQCVSPTILLILKYCNISVAIVRIITSLMMMIIIIISPSHCTHYFISLHYSHLGYNSCMHNLVYEPIYIHTSPTYIYVIYKILYLSFMCVVRDARFALFSFLALIALIISGYLFFLGYLTTLLVQRLCSVGR